LYNNINSNNNNNSKDDAKIVVLAEEGEDGEWKTQMQVFLFFSLEEED
jgi:hypothetical protein